MFILDTDHVSLFQRNDPHVSARVLATPPLELATTVVTVEEQLSGCLDRASCSVWRPERSPPSLLIMIDHLHFQMRGESR
jgi:predicted nucleic acid-binding protein